MNASLLAVTTASPAASGPTGASAGATMAANGAGSSDSGDLASSPFAELLDLAAGLQLQGMATPTEPETSEFPSDEAAAELVEGELAEPSLVPVLLLPGEAVEAQPNPAELTAVTEDADVLAVAMATTMVDDPPTVTTNPDEVSATTLPLAGKSLPPWPVLMRMPPSRAPDAEAAVPAAPQDISVAEDWQALIDSAGKLAPTIARADSNNLPAARAAEPLLALTTLSIPEPKLTTTGSSEAAPGIAVRSPYFATLLGNQVLWQAKVGNSQAEIRLDPPDLGPIDVRISQRDNETHLHFVVGHSTTRDQLEQALPRLRELFGQGGLQLGQVEVEQGRRDNPSAESEQNRAGTGKRQSESGQPEIAGRPTLLSTSLIDDYA